MTMHVLRSVRCPPPRTLSLVVPLLVLTLASTLAIAQGGDAEAAPPAGDASPRVHAILGAESAPPDRYTDPNLLKPFVNLETESRLAGLPVRQHPVNAGLFEEGCAQCHRLAGPVPATSAAPPDVFDAFEAEPVNEPAPMGFRRLTTDAARAEFPTWSPDGRHILYERRDDEGRWALWIAPVDGSATRPLVETGNASWAEWSPEGRRIVFWAEDEAGRGNVWLLDAEGGAPRQLTHAEATAFPVWSPDGRRIAYQAKDETGTWSLRLLDPSDETSRRITPQDQIMPSRPQFSPDGRQIAYQVADQGQFGLWRLEFPARADGMPNYEATPRSVPGSTLLPMDIGQARYSGIWSPDGARIALQMLGLSSTPEGTLRLTYKTWLTNPDGSEADLLVPTATLADRSPSWSPSGRWLVQWSWNHDLTASVWLARADGGADPVDLTASLGGDALYPAWSPDGTRVAFASNRSGTFDIWVADVAEVVDGFKP